MQNELISVIVPVYNTARYLPACVGGLLNQTYRTLEVLLIDDGSTDGSGVLCDRFAARDSRVRAVHKANGGVSSARNEGLRLASGEYILFADGDDTAELTLAEELLELIRREEAPLACCGYIQEDEDGREIKRTEAFPDQAVPQKELLNCYTNYTTPAVWGKLFRTRLIKGRYGLRLSFDEGLTVAEDMLFFYQYLKDCAFANCSSRPLYHYLLRRSGKVYSRFTPDKLTNLTARERIMELLDGNDEALYAARMQYTDICVNLLATMRREGYQNREDRDRLKRCIREALPSYLRNPWSSVKYKLAAAGLAILP